MPGDALPLPAGEAVLRSVDRLSPTEAAAVQDVAAAATAVDGTAPLDEHVRLQLGRSHEPDSLDVLVEQGDRLVAYAHLDAAGATGDGLAGGPAPHAQLVVVPGARGHGIGRHLVQRLLERTGGRLHLWAHGERSDVARMVAPLGFERARTLLQLRRPLTGPGAAPLAEPRLPDGTRLRTFAPGRDEASWVALNAAAFAEHPEQGRWTLEDLRRREAEPWFDPAGLFLAERLDPDGAAGPRLVGSHWTKVHPATADVPAVGEVYVVGVHPAEQGSGLGRALTLVGLHHLRDAGLGQVLLYVDGDNVAAVRLYESLGFARWDTDVLYARS